MNFSLCTDISSNDGYRSNRPAVGVEVSDMSPTSEGLPQANNCTGRTIGRSKIRYKTVRGYKSEEGMMNGWGLTLWVWSGMNGRDLSELIAA